MDQAFRTGFESTAAHDASFLLSETDNKSFISQQFQGLLDIKGSLDEGAILIQQEARAARLDALKGMNFTADEMAGASDFISTMSEEGRLRREFLSQSDDVDMQTLAQMLESGETVDLDMNAAGMRHLYEKGLFDEYTDANGLKHLGQTERAERQILAVSNLLAENDASLDMLMSMGDEGGGSIFDLHNSAFQRHITGPKLLDEIKGINTIDGLSEFIEQGNDGLKFTAKAQGIYDPTERSVALLDRITSINNAKSFGAEKKALMGRQSDFLLNEIEASGQAEAADINMLSDSVRTSLRGFEGDPTMLRMPIGSFRYRAKGTSYVGPTGDGTKRLGARAISDELADDVVNVRSVRDTMRSLDTAALKELWGHAGFRKGIIGAGIFAGFGVAYHMAKDPTPEEAGGPPLMPGGSPYENYPMPNMDMVSSMYSQTPQTPQGMLYQVSATGNFNTNDLSSSIARIGGGSPMRTNIGNARQVLANPATSVTRLNEMMGI
jgi:hypothetical protein